MTLRSIMKRSMLISFVSVTHNIIFFLTEDGTNFRTIGPTYRNFFLIGQNCHNMTKKEIRRKYVIFMPKMSLYTKYFQFVVNCIYINDDKFMKLMRIITIFSFFFIV